MSNNLKGKEMLKKFLSKLFKKKPTFQKGTPAPIPKDEYEAAGLIKCELNVVAYVDPKKNAFTVFDKLIFKGQADRMGVLLKRIGMFEETIKELLDYSNSVKTMDNEVEVHGPYAEDKAPDISNMTDEQMREFLKKQNQDLFDD